MDLNLSEGDSVAVIVKKCKNSYVTVIQNLPADRMEKILSTCRSKFGCGGNVVKDAAKPSILLQGDQKHNIERHRGTIFDGLDMTMNEMK